MGSNFELKSFTTGCHFSCLRFGQMLQVILYVHNYFKTDITT